MGEKVVTNLYFPPMLSSQLRGLRFFDFISDYIHLSPPSQKSNFSWRTFKKLNCYLIILIYLSPLQNWNSHGEQISDLISPVPPHEFKLFMENLDFRSNHLDLPPDLQNRSLSLPPPTPPPQIQTSYCHRASWGSAVLCKTRDRIEIITITAVLFD